ncbi:MAG: hypothetical protein ACT4P5_07625 [Armatimonadota bacterium]
MRTTAAAAGNLGLLPAAIATLTERLRLAYTVSFRSRWKRLTWLVSAALFLVILLLTGAIASLPAPAQFPFPAGTVRFSWAKGYLWWVVTPHVMTTFVASQLARGLFLALAYGVSITLAVVRSRTACCQPLALGGAALVFGSLGISFCCGPLVGLIGALGLASVATRLWSISIGSLIATLLFLTMTVRLEKVAPLTEKVERRV